MHTSLVLAQFVSRIEINALISGERRALPFALNWLHLANGKLLFDELGGEREDGALHPFALHAHMCLSVLRCVLRCVRTSVSRSSFKHAVSRNSFAHALSLLPLLTVHLVPMKAQIHLMQMNAQFHLVPMNAQIHLVQTLRSIFLPANVPSCAVAQIRLQTLRSLRHLNSYRSCVCLFLRSLDMQRRCLGPKRPLGEVQGDTPASKRIRGDQPGGPMT